MTTGWIEILGRSERLIQRHQLNAEQRIILGRGYDCDVIVDDPYVDARHLSITLDTDGQKLTLEDLNSINGLFSPRGRKRQDKLMLLSGQSARIGHHIIRFRSTTHPVAIAQPDPTANSPLRAFESAAFIVFCVLLALVASSLEIQLSYHGSEIAPPLISGLTMRCAAILVWAMLWATAAQLLGNTFRLQTHIGIAALGMATTVLLPPVLETLTFMADLDALLSVSVGTAQALAFALIVYSHLRFVSTANLKRQATWALIAALVSFLPFSIPAWLKASEFFPSPRYEVTLKLPMLAFGEGGDVQSLDNTLNSLRADLAKADK